MCQTAIISDKIIKVGTKTFELRISAYDGITYNANKLRRLNNNINQFCKILYDQYESVTATDYNVFKDQLNLLISNIDKLIQTYTNIAIPSEVKRETEKLSLHNSELKEIQYDIEHFKLNPSIKLQSLFNEVTSTKS